SGTPAAGTDAGSPYSVTISATYSTGSGAITGSGTLTLTINPAPPVITSRPTASGTVGNAFSYQITATNNPTSYDATGLPGGLTVNTTTGVISGTTTAVGAFSVTISAIYGTGSSAITGSGTLALTITFPDGSFTPPFPGQKNDFDTGLTQDPRNDP